MASVSLGVLGLIWAISRSGFKTNTGRMVRVEAKGKTLTEGFIGANGSINQPTYEMIMVNVSAPQTKLVYQTKKVKANGNGETYKWGVVKILKPDNGRRTYDVPYLGKDATSAPLNAKVFQNLESPIGYATVEWNTITNGLPTANNGIGRKGWYLRGSSSVVDEASAQTYADNLYNNMVANNEPTEPSEPEDEPTFPTQPTLPPMGTPSQPMPSFVEATEVGTVIEVDDYVDVVDTGNSVLPNQNTLEEVVVVAPVANLKPTQKGLTFNKKRGLGGF